MAKWIAAEKVRAGLRHAVVCPNATRRTKERTIQSKRGHAGSLAIVDWPQVAQTRILRVVFADAILPFSVLFCFTFVFFLLSLEPRPFVQSFFDIGTWILEWRHTEVEKGSM